MVKATVLCENSVFGVMGVIAEHGWSVYVETPEGNYLFDTGQGLGLLNNAKVFKKDLTALKGIILSHHHVDHTGGLLTAVKAAEKEIDVYTHPDLFKSSYAKRKDVSYIGIPFSQAALEASGAKFHFNHDFAEIAPGIYLTGEIPRRNTYETTDQALVVRDLSGQYGPDPLVDDQTLVLKTSEGLLVLLGCAHAGIVNILNYIQEKTGEERIAAVIGGTHLSPAGPIQIQTSIESLLALNIKRIGVSHCTGMRASMELAAAFGDRFFFCNLGAVIEI